MKIETIFEIVKGALAAVKYEEEAKDAFHLCFDQWSDVEYLVDFFEANRIDLSTEFWGLTVEDAVNMVLAEAEMLEEALFTYARKGITSPDIGLDDFVFHPLDKGLYKNIRVMSKAYGRRRGKSLLRMYAIRLGPGKYIITGGTIKLTAQMNDRIHTKVELQKLILTSAYLKSLGIDDQDDYGFIEFAQK